MCVRACVRVRERERRGKGDLDLLYTYFECKCLIELISGEAQITTHNYHYWIFLRHKMICAVGRAFNSKY